MNTAYHFYGLLFDDPAIVPKGGFWTPGEHYSTVWVGVHGNPQTPLLCLGIAQTLTVALPWLSSPCRPRKAPRGSEVVLKHDCHRLDVPFDPARLGWWLASYCETTQEAELIWQEEELQGVGP